MSVPRSSHTEVFAPGKDDRTLLCPMCRCPVAKCDRDNFFEVWRKATEDQQRWREAGYHRNWMKTDRADAKWREGEWEHRLAQSLGRPKTDLER